MTITMPIDAQEKLITTIRMFLDTTLSHHRSLIEWQWILGWINWALNVFPLCCPALQSAYTKIAGKQVSCAKIFLNRTVIREFSWLATTIESSDGVHMLDAIEWDESLVDLTIYCDASLNGISFVAPALKTGFCSAIPTDCPIQTIFYFESLSVHQPSCGHLASIPQSNACWSSPTL